MSKINIEQYFENTEIKCYEPRILITILEDIFGKDIDTIKIELDELKINVTTKQIIEYLNNRFEKENKEVKAHLENPRTIEPLSDKIEFNEISIEDFKDSTQAIGDQLIAARYEFDSYTLNYFNKYSDIVRNKAKKILDIIEKIANKDFSTIADIITKLDIQLDENGNISKEDIIRLITPFVYNYNLLVEKVNTANNLETYLEFKLSKHSLYRAGCSEGELYPTSSIQVNSLFSSSSDNVPLSGNQKKNLEIQCRKHMRKSLKLLSKYKH